MNILETNSRSVFHLAGAAKKLVLFCQRFLLYGFLGYFNPYVSGVILWFTIKVGVLIARHVWVKKVLGFNV